MVRRKKTFRNSKIKWKSSQRNREREREKIHVQNDQFKNLIFFIVCVYVCLIAFFIYFEINKFPKFLRYLLLFFLIWFICSHSIKSDDVQPNIALKLNSNSIDSGHSFPVFLLFIEERKKNFSSISLEFKIVFIQHESVCLFVGFFYFAKTVFQMYMT